MFKRLKVETPPAVVIKNTPQTVQARLVSETGEEAGPPIDLPVGVTVSQLGLICNALLENVTKFSSFACRNLINFIQFDRMNQHHFYFSLTKKK